jgi:hypothetical protein
LFRPNANENGANYNKLSLIYDDGVTTPDRSYGTFRFITILPINDAPEILVESERVSYDNHDVFIVNWSNFTGEVQVNGTHDYGLVSASSYVNVGLSFVDHDAFDAPNLDFEIKIVNKPISNDKERINGALFGVPSDKVTEKTDDLIRFTSSIASANELVKNLQFTTDVLGEYTIEVTVWDNGNSGKYCPPPKINHASSSCPRASKAVFTLTTTLSDQVITGVATGVGAGVLALAALGAFLGAKFFKSDESDQWKEWETNDMGDVALQNPTFQQGTTTGQSLISQN